MHPINFSTPVRPSSELSDNDPLTTLSPIYTKSEDFQKQAALIDATRHPRLPSAASFFNEQPAGPSSKNPSEPPPLKRLRTIEQSNQERIFVDLTRDRSSSYAESVEQKKDLYLEAAEDSSSEIDLAEPEMDLDLEAMEDDSDDMEVVEITHHTALSSLEAIASQQAPESPRPSTPLNAAVSFDDVTPETEEDIPSPPKRSRSLRTFTLKNQSNVLFRAILPKPALIPTQLTSSSSTTIHSSSITSPRPIPPRTFTLKNQSNVLFRAILPKPALIPTHATSSSSTTTHSSLITLPRPIPLRTFTLKNQSKVLFRTFLPSPDLIATKPTSSFSLKGQHKVRSAATKLRPNFIPLESSYKPHFTFVDHVKGYSVERIENSRSEAIALALSNYPQYTPLIDVRHLIKVNFAIQVNENFSKREPNLSSLIHVIGHKPDGTSSIYPLDSIAEIGSIKNIISKRSNNKIEGSISFKPGQVSTIKENLFTFDFVGHRFFDRALLLSRIDYLSNESLESALQRIIKEALSEDKGCQHRRRCMASLWTARENSQMPPVKLSVSDEAETSYNSSSL